MKHSKLATGRISRLAGLVRAGLGAKAAAGGKNTKEKVEKAAQLMGQLRGLATKVGQLASYVDGLVPEEHRGLFEGAMGKLRDAAASSSPEEVRARIEQELGASITELFADFEDQPIASASIGQVHRARLKDGSEVAVKVQHPGIVEAVEADLRNVGMMEILMKLGGTDKNDAKQLIKDIRDRFREELDYTIEARHGKNFIQLHAEDTQIVIPAVVEAHSSQHVLTTAFVDGKNFEEACAADEAERTAWAKTMWRFVYRANLLAGEFNADPHPGNYIFLPDGKVGFIDFGCVQPIGETRRYWSARVHAAAGNGDEEGFANATKKLFGTRGGLFEKLALEYARLAFRPLFESPFRVTRTFSGSLAKQLGHVADQMRKNKNDGHVAMPEGGLFINRLQFGFYSVLARLDVEVDFAAEDRHYLEKALSMGTPPAA